MYPRWRASPLKVHQLVGNHVSRRRDESFATLLAMNLQKGYLARFGGCSLPGGRLPVFFCTQLVILAGGHIFLVLSHCELFPNTLCSKQALGSLHRNLTQLLFLSSPPAIFCSFPPDCWLCSSSWSLVFSTRERHFLMSCRNRWSVAQPCTLSTACFTNALFSKIISGARAAVRNHLISAGLPAKFANQVMLSA